MFILIILCFLAFLCNVAPYLATVIIAGSGCIQNCTYIISHGKISLTFSNFKLGWALWSEDREVVSRSDRRWHCRGWLIMMRARHNKARARRRSLVIGEDLEGPTSRLLQAGWRGFTLRTSLPPSFLRYTDRISGEFRHPEALDSRDQFEELVAWVCCLEKEDLLRLVVGYLWGKRGIKNLSRASSTSGLVVLSTHWNWSYILMYRSQAYSVTR